MNNTHNRSSLYNITCNGEEKENPSVAKEKCYCIFFKSGAFETCGKQFLARSENFFEKMSFGIFLNLASRKQPWPQPFYKNMLFCPSLISLRQVARGNNMVDFVNIEKFIYWQLQITFWSLTLNNSFWAQRTGLCIGNYDYTISTQ